MSQPETAWHSFQQCFLWPVAWRTSMSAILPEFQQLSCQQAPVGISFKFAEDVHLIRFSTSILLAVKTFKL